MNIGKEGEVALSRWCELGSMPAILSYPIKIPFLSTHDKFSVESISLILSETKTNVQGLFLCIHIK